MKRSDLYSIALAIFNIYLFFAILSTIRAGAGLSLMGEQSPVGYFSIALYMGAFLSIFYNLSKLIPVILASHEEIALQHITTVARATLFALLAYTLMEFLQALAYFSTFQS